MTRQEIEKDAAMSGDAFAARVVQANVALRMQNAQLRQAVTELLDDAERYRWLRDDTPADAPDPEYGVFRCGGMYPTGEAMLSGHDLDAAIDRAIEMGAEASDV